MWNTNYKVSKFTDFIMFCVYINYIESFIETLQWDLIIEYYHLSLSMGKNVLIIIFKILDSL